MISMGAPLSMCDSRPRMGQGPRRRSAGDLRANAASARSGFAYLKQITGSTEVVNPAGGIVVGIVHSFIVQRLPGAQVILSVPAVAQRTSSTGSFVVGPRSSGTVASRPVTGIRVNHDRPRFGRLAG